MIKIVKLISIFFLTETLLASCVVVPSARLLILASDNVSERMIDQFVTSAAVCGFSDVIRNELPSSSPSQTYVVARSTPNNLAVTLARNSISNNIEIGESDSNRNRGEGFTSSDLEKFSCFENELKRRHPNEFVWTVRNQY